VKTCNVCEYRYPKEEGGLEACPRCSKDRHCQKRHIKDHVRCKHHGGKSRAGLSHRGLKHARKSRYLDVLDPKGKKDYQGAQEGPNKLSLEEDIDLLDMRVRRLLSGEPSRSFWKEVGSTFEEFASAQSAKDRDRSLAALQKLAELIRGGENEAKRWGEIEQLAFVRRPRMALTETRRKVHLAEMIHMAWVHDMMRFLTASIYRHVKDPDALNNITTDLRRIAGGVVLDVSPTGGGEAGGDY
jgi:hypothetical protein